MDQEGIHLRCFCLKPAVWVEAIAIFTKYFGVTVNDPRIHAKNSLESAVSDCHEDVSGRHYPFCENSAGDRNSTAWGDSRKTKTNGGMEPICLF